MLASLFLAVHLVLPQLAGLRRTYDTLVHGSWWLPAAMIALEAASFAAYGELTLSLLHAQGQHPPRGLVQRTTVVGAGRARSRGVQ